MSANNPRIRSAAARRRSTPVALALTAWAVLCGALAFLCTLAMALSAQAEIAQKGNLRVSVSGKLAPKKLPRKGTAPISVSVGGRITTTDQTLPPQLKTLRIELNRNGRLDYKGLPTCKFSRIQPGSSSRALSQCRSSLVGKGSFTANITLAGQEPYPTKGRLLVFNSKRGRKPVLYGHIYSPKPFAREMPRPR